MRSPFGLSLLGIGVALLLGAEVASADVPTATRIAGSNLMDPEFSADGKRLLITGERMHGIGEVAISTGDVVWHLDEARIGVQKRYVDRGGIGFVAKRAGKRRHLRIDAGGTISEVHPPEPRVFAANDAIYLRSTGGVSRISSGDRFFAPILSPDGSKVAYTGLATGIHVYDIATQTQIRLGAGTEPAWSPDSKSLVFERTEDDGHTIVGSDLWLWRKGSGAKVLIHTPNLIERRPSFSPDGTQIAFDDDRGFIYIMSADQGVGAKQ